MILLFRTLAALLAALAWLSTARADMPDPSNWDAVLAEAKGETVYFYAWGGEPRINDYIDWAAKTVLERFGVRVIHVKVSDTAEAVSRVLGEKAAGRTKGGAVDLVWVNGENFAALKRNGLLLPAAWSDRLPNYRFVDVENKPTVARDFTVPVEGLEAPWGMAKLVFFYDSARLSDPPRSAAALGEWIAKNPGRFTYPQPPDFSGTTFLKQLLLELAPDPGVLVDAASDQNFAAATGPLFAWLDAAQPNLWRGGRAFPRDYGSLRRLLADVPLTAATTRRSSSAKRCRLSLSLTCLSLYRRRSGRGTAVTVFRSHPCVEYAANPSAVRNGSGRSPYFAATSRPCSARPAATCARLRLPAD